VYYDCIFCVCVFVLCAAFGVINNDLTSQLR